MAIERVSLASEVVVLVVEKAPYGKVIPVIGRVSLRVILAIESVLLVIADGHSCHWNGHLIHWKVHSGH